MPGSVSDSFDPEFGTGENADLIRDAVRDVLDRIVQQANLPEPQDIVDVVRRGLNGPFTDVRLGRREWRVVRFALSRAINSL